ncbi:hypothetical protein SAMN05192558_104235 [Actinokineospora alba]|uniref:Uncharacterized protein n=1 Tax=Actinokineospora alba TaxID=504798 RepID=A0A1H0LQ55_9PSEU|nr:hypothetical protein C8E96_2952 [Actinokineospora alba]SDI97487.1 hypothetical protein SAMN05421871_10962 [Actinokineospora alba]SDO70265.1 hypothetical protein SAMN05192558_104235 [Actinokineospora alba]
MAGFGLRRETSAVTENPSPEQAVDPEQASAVDET